tara:strand:+ start:291 stop:944 length:654 start_codon:yes stop_codon:yes gene_type:complete
MSVAPSSKRVYHNFPGTNGFKYNNYSEWSEIGRDVYQSNTRGTGILFEPAKFKSYIQRYVRSAKRMRNQKRRLTRNAGLYTTNVPNYSNNRGFEIYAGDKAKWYKWPTSEQISNLHQSFRTYISTNNYFNNSNNNSNNNFFKNFFNNSNNNANTAKKKKLSLVEQQLFNALGRAKNQKSIRQAYLKGALKLHPNKGGDAELFKKFKAKYILKKKVSP